MAVGLTSWLYVSQEEDFLRHTLHYSFFSINLKKKILHNTLITISPNKDGYCMVILQ